MVEELNMTGRCMCSAIRLSAIAKSPDVAVCHCDMCRRWSSRSNMEVTCQKVTFEGEENIGRIRSSDWAERALYAKCGSNLFHHIIHSGEYQVSEDFFGEQSTLHMSLQVFTDHRRPYYEFSNETNMMTGAEVCAAFATRPD